jgi:hypothetical protein
LKAYLTSQQIAFGKTHELSELVAACAQIDATLGAVLDAAIPLSQWRFRYPGCAV